MVTNRSRSYPQSRIVLVQGVHTHSELPVWDKSGMSEQKRGKILDFAL